MNWRRHSAARLQGNYGAARRTFLTVETNMATSKNKIQTLNGANPNCGKGASGHGSHAQARVSQRHCHIPRATKDTSRKPTQRLFFGSMAAQRTGHNQKTISATPVQVLLEVTDEAELLQFRDTICEKQKGIRVNDLDTPKISNNGRGKFSPLLLLIFNFYSHSAPIFPKSRDIYLL